jgi:hypothetical protein
MHGNGFLAIWSDVQPAQETDYLHWLTREHTTERVSIPGFLAVRVFRALTTDVRRFFILYELEEPEVMASADYLSRLNSPTPWSQRIMPILGNFARGGGRCTASKGIGQGGFVAPILLRGAAATEAFDALDNVITMDRIAAVRLLETDNSRTSIRTTEKQLRQNDSSFEGLVLIEGLDENAVQSAIHRVFRDNKDLPRPNEVMLYVHFFGLHQADISAPGLLRVETRPFP